MEERAIDRLRKFARYARDKGVVKGENSFEAYCELSNRYIYNSIRNGKGAIGTDIIARIVDKFPELNVKWLCTGKGNMIETDIDANVNYKAAYEGAMMQIEALHKIIEENKRKWIGTGVKVYSDQWNDRKKIINSVEMIQLNQCLDEQLRVIQNWINELISKKEVFDFDKLDRFLRYTNKSESFVDFVERRIEERGDITESTKASHRTFAASLREFDRIIYFSDLTKANITLYDDWLHAKGYSQPTIYNYHKRNKRYIHEAIKFDLLKNDPYKGERFSRGKHAIRKYLTAEELKKVKDAQIDSETICRVRDLFIFQAYTGISYADLAKFNFKRDVQKRGNKYVILDIRLKTEENYFIVLLPPAMEILRKYDYVLPIISNQQYNLRLKIVADYAELDRNLTVHMSRHTFATMCLNNGVKMENVSKMLGHTNVRTTQQYAKVLNAEVEKDFEMLERILS